MLPWLFEALQKNNAESLGSVVIINSSPVCGCIWYLPPVITSDSTLSFSEKNNHTMLNYLVITERIAVGLSTGTDRQF